MHKRLIPSFLLLCLSVITSVHAKTIVWVAESGRDDDGDGINDSQVWADKLTSAGYTVDFRPGNWESLTAAQAAELSAADLVIVSCTTQSSNYATDSTEVGLWNSVTAPMMLCSPYIARSTRWQWVNNADGTLPNNNGDQGSPLLQAVVPQHPIFYGITLDASNQLKAVDPTLGSGHASFLATNNPGNGTLLAKTVPTDLVQDWCWIVEWKKGVTFFNGTTYTTPNLRMFVMGIGAHEVAGSFPMRGYNLTDEGWKLYLNTVKYMLGERLLPPTMAADPYPLDGETGVLPSIALHWTPGVSARTHDVYLGTSLADVNIADRTSPHGVLLKQDQDVNSVDPPGNFAFGTTHYWRVDEVNAAPDSSVHKGVVWSFTTEPYGFRVKPVKAAVSSSMAATMGPDKTIDGSGLDAEDQHGTSSTTMWVSKKGQTPIWIQYEFDKAYKLYQMWVWNSNQAVEPTVGFGAKDVKVETSTDGAAWTALANVPEFNQATGEPNYVYNTTVDFAGVQAKFVKLTINSNWADSNKQASLSEVRFFYVPVKAYSPAPATGASVAINAVLSWRPGREAARHEVYVSTDSAAVANGTAPVKTVTDHELPLASLGVEYAKTYAWKVNEVNEAADPKSWEGDLWGFSTQEYGIVDDFEPYDDNCNRIFFAWVDGYGHSGSTDCGVAPSTGNGSGSMVGNSSPPFAEWTVVHGGRQAMPLVYDNTAGKSFSEATRTFQPTQDWTVGGAKTLVLFFCGDSGNTTGQLYLKINDKQMNYSGGSAALTTGLWKQWNVDLASAGTNLKAVKSLTIGASGSGKGILRIDDIRLYREAPAVVAPTDPGTGALSLLYKMEADLTDGSGTGNNGTAEGGPIYVEGPVGYGKALQFDGIDDDVVLPIGNLIGTTTSCTVATWVNLNTGNSGSWERVFDFGTSSTAGYMFLSPRQSTNGTMRFAITTGTNTGESGVNSPTNLPAGWHHVAIIIDGTAKTIQLCRDGEVVASGPTAVIPKDLGKTTQNWLGRSQWSSDAYFAGILDDFRIYTRALSTGEVRYLAGDR